MTQIVVRVSVRGSGAFQGAAAAVSMNNPEIKRALKQVVSVYEAFARRRFNVYSRGGGDWAPLALVTTRRRRRGGKAKGGVDFGGGRSNGLSLGRGARSSIARDTRNKNPALRGRLVNARGTFSILRDKGFLFNALTIGAAGNRVTELPNGIEFGFSGVPHPGADLSITKLASIHHFGSPKKRIPARPILAMPDDATLSRIRAVMQAGVARAIRKSSGGKR